MWWKLLLLSTCFSFEGYMFFFNSAEETFGTKSDFLHLENSDSQEGFPSNTNSILTGT
jgi:hypothetical protein